MNDPLNHDPMTDELFRNRIAAALREIEQPESDADIAAALDAVADEPLSDDATARIMQNVRRAMWHDAPRRVSVPASSASVPINDSARSRPTNSVRSQVAMLATCVALLVGIGLMFQRFGEIGLPAKDRNVAKLSPRPGELLSAADQTGHRRQEANPPDATDLRTVVPQVGETLNTGPREKRRVTLQDGSILSINEQSQVAIVGPRRLKLLAGEVYVEVVPIPPSRSGKPVEADRFVVETPQRRVTALGTKFVVKAQGSATNVIVTQGKVRVSGVDEVIPAGHELIADLTTSHAAKLRPAKRSAYVVEWVKDLMAAAGAVGVPSSEHAGGTVTVVDPQGQEMKLSLRKFHIDVYIEDGFARTTIDQTYFNHTWQQLEGTFRFPLPADASLSRLAMYVNGTLMEGGMVERDYGRNVFEQIRHTRRDPALLEWVDGSTFQMRVFPLEARQEKRILLSYTQRLTSDYGKSVYRFPAGHTLDGVRDWSTQVRVKGAAGTKWHSPSHLLNGREDQGDLLIDGRDQSAALDRDLVVELGEERLAAANAEPAWSNFEQDGYRYVMLRLRPELLAKSDAGANAVSPPRHWTFLVENSADRNEVLAETQRQIARVLLENSEHSDTFSIIRAGAQAESFRSRPVECTLENIAAAQKFLRDVAPIGALDLGQALQLIRKADTDRNVRIVHLGTGIPVLGERDESTLLRLLPTKAQYIAVAVGKRWSKSFMESAARHSGGHVTQINPDEAVAWRAFDLLSTLNAPRLTAIALQSNFGAESDSATGTRGAAAADFLLLTNALAHGQECAAVARFANGKPLPKSITITGQLNGRPYSQTIPAPESWHAPSVDNAVRGGKPSSVAAQSGHLPRTWARAEIDRLVALGATEHKSQIVELSKAMYVMSPFTSLLVLETEAMYEQFKVDRGRKDHWAMYPAPAQIPVVADQGPAQTSPLEAANDRLKQAQNRVRTAQTNYDRSVVERRPEADLKRLDRLKRAEQADVQLIEREIRRIERANEAAADPVRMAWESVILRRTCWQHEYARRLAVRYRNHWGLTTWEDSSQDLGFIVPLDVSNGRAINLGRWSATRELNRRSFLNFTDDDFGSAPMNRWYRPGVTDFIRGANVSGNAMTGLFALSPADDGLPTSVRLLNTTDAYDGFMNWNGPVVLTDELSDIQGRGESNGTVVFDADGLSTVIPYYFDRLGGELELEEMSQRLPGLRTYSFGRVAASARSGFTRHGDVRLRQYQTDWGETSSSFAIEGTEVSDERLFDFALQQIVVGNDQRSNLYWSRDSFYYATSGGREFELWRKLASSYPLAGVFKDLPSYAPGLQSWPADRLAVVEQTVGNKPKSGHVDAEARRLIERSRSLGWEKIRLVSGVKSPPGRSEHIVVADGAGRFVSEREVGEGLKETAINDGTTLWHLYPEIGLGAKRTISRFHQSAIQSLIPWHVPSADDLSVDADVKLVGNRTVRITSVERQAPLDGATAKPPTDEDKGAAKQDPAGQQRIAVELVFADDDRLGELRVVDLTAGKQLARQTFAADGTVRAFNSADELVVEMRYERQSAAAPSLIPVTDGLLVLPLPYRSASGVPVSVPVNLQSNSPDYTKLSDDDSLKLLATYFAEARSAELHNFIEQRFTLRADHRIGLMVLLACVNPTSPLVMSATRQHPESPLARFLEQFAGYPAQGNLHGTLDAGQAASPFLKRVCSAYNHYCRWTNAGPDSDVERDLESTLLFVRDSRSLALAGRMLATVQASLLRNHRMNASLARQLNIATAEIAETRNAPAFGRTARIDWLLTIGDDDSTAQAKSLLKSQLADAIASTGNLDLNAQTRAAFVKHFKTPEGQSCEPWGMLVKEASQKLIDRKELSAVIGLTRQCVALGERALAAEIFHRGIKVQDLIEQPKLNLAAFEYAKNAGQWEIAESCIQRALADPELQKNSTLWRDSAEIAHHLKKFHDWITYLDKASEMEFAALPKTVNVESFRQDYDRLFGQLEERAAHLADADESGKLAFARVVERAAARWREIDVDDTNACHRTARMLTKLGLTAAAWNYWTTPLADTPDQSSVWQKFAVAMNSEQRFVVADRAWSTAFECESTNPEILLQHAQFLRSTNQSARARDLLTRIASATWQPRFDAVKNQAQALLNGDGSSK